jgi:hypothetical protein
MKKLLVIPFMLGLSACNSTTAVKPVLTERPKIVLSQPRPVEQLPVQWTVLTRKNMEKKLAEIERNGGQATFIATTPEGYKNLSLNAAELRRYIEQQNARADAIQKYYEGGN